jgi:hypothetical protein
LGGAAGWGLHIEQSLYLFDLVGISLRTGANLLPAFLRDAGVATLDELKTSFAHETVCPLLWSSGPRLRLAQGPEQLRALRGAWLEAIKKHPRAWLGHRIALSRALFGLDRYPFYPYQQGIEPNDLGVVKRESRLNRATMRVLGALQNTPVFRGWVYCLLVLAALVGSLWVPKSLPVVPMLCLSGGLYALANVFISPASDFRLNWWLVVCAVVAALLVLLRSLEALLRCGSGQEAC